MHMKDMYIDIYGSLLFWCRILALYGFVAMLHIARQHH